MASIYIHIPFCKTKCHYCNFFSTVSQKDRPELINSIVDEIGLRHDYLDSNIIDSIYFGGGTPSLLTEMELNSIFSKINEHFILSLDCEITLEANPDDISIDKLKLFKDQGINRLSIGIQSFDDGLLEKLNRIHTSKDAIKSVELSKKYGFENLSIDLIFGIPGLNNELWEKEIDIFLNMNIPHLSSYFLTVEPNTALHHLIKKNKYPNVDEKLGIDHFKILMDKIYDEKYDHYEISNYALNGMISKHNSNYWKSKSYLGIGPSSHSYNFVSRQWNASSIKKYIESIKNGNRFLDFEELSLEDRYNEFVMLGLRTSWGINISEVENIFGSNISNYFKTRINITRFKENTIITDNCIKLTRNGKILADGLAAELFIT